MAGPGSKGEVSLWIKLLIWALVISAGVIYLRWVYEKGREPRQAQLLARSDPLIPIEQPASVLRAGRLLGMETPNERISLER